ncbi:MAG: exopolysaccharide biosynthesis polyprenyl glycosylphosphotransferase [Chthoniobacter sp.]|nr:exopolysaccharide biosynthesis polyprenyl glycosylphosphotransferase [Chthoniobacter sp.]
MEKDILQYKSNLSQIFAPIAISVIGGLLIFLSGLVAMILVDVFSGGADSDFFASNTRLCTAGTLAYIFGVFVSLITRKGHFIGGDPKNIFDEYVFMTLIVFIVLVYVLNNAIDRYDICWLIVWFLVVYFAVPAEVRVWRAIMGRRALRAVLARPAVVVGTGAAALRLVQTGRSPAGEDLQLLGFFDDRTQRLETLRGHLPYLGSMDELAEFVADHENLHVYMAFPWTAGARIISLMERLRFLPITVWLLPDPDLPIPLSETADPFDVFAMPLLAVPPLSYWDRIAKTVFDFIAGSAILIASLPVLAAVAVWIKLDSPGPVFFLQERVGQFGRRFMIYKFRSLYKPDHCAAALVREGDPRVTRAGRFIRKYSLDELPQILNVLKGDMSLVGPRPHALEAKAGDRFYADVISSYSLRHRVKPGMTGWAQVNGWRGNTDTPEKIEKRVEYDFYYIRNWSIWLDLKILFMTIRPILFPKGNV